MTEPHPPITRFYAAHMGGSKLAWHGPASTQRPLDLGSSWVNILIASLAAAWALLGPGGVKALLAGLAPGALGVLTGALAGFVLHEYAHERAAYRHGCWARFVLHPLGLALTLVSGFLPFAIIAPGAVSVACPHWGYGWSSAEEDIASAGVKVNLGLAALGVLAKILSHSWIVSSFASGFASINAWVALFNLIPFPPLDGWRLSRINPTSWAILFTVAIILLTATMLL